SMPKIYFEIGAAGSPAAGGGGGADASVAAGVGPSAAGTGLAGGAGDAGVSVWAGLVSSSEGFGAGVTAGTGSALKVASPLLASPFALSSLVPSDLMGSVLPSPAG